MAKQQNETRQASEQAPAAACELDALARLAQGVAESEVKSPPVAANPLAEDPELVQEFLMEAREHLSRIESLMIEIESGSGNPEPVHGVFRCFHTIKGLAGFLDFEAIQEIAHEVETLLDRVRNSTLVLIPARVDVVLQAGDAIAAWLQFIEDPSLGQPADHAPLVERIKAAMESGADAAGQGDEDAADGAPSESWTGAQEGVQAGEAVRAQAGPRGGGASESGQKVEAAAVKVATSKLEYLVDMVGELVIAQSMLRHNPDLATVRTPRLQRDVAQLGRVTAEVQKTAMAMRMMPVGQLFRKMNRLVRDLARKSGKRAQLEMIGEDVELDRTLVEELADPLVHMIRNSMDHGLEPPAEREAAGKCGTGRLRLSASHQAGQIVIGISDDGRGLNKRRILDKALARGLVTPSSNPSDQEIYHLIFQPGFSTAERVTDVSGRGVGMDVVRKQVEKLRGRIEIESRPGLGSTFLLKLPLTLAIIEGLVVMAGGERYIVPLFSVREMAKLAPESIFTVEGKGEMAMVRNRLVPVTRLARKLGLGGAGRDASEGLMLVGESEGREFCLVVEEMVGKQEVVIKTLGPAFSHVRGISGGAILGDGRVGLILDVGVLLKPQEARAA
ncbi:MAG TPA: chemotaxis protein CheA [Bryobacteraceae bacterium]|nr:chemotaxis protein CheA [Bryobacteraceae bacterium]